MQSTTEMLRDLNRLAKQGYVVRSPNAGDIYKPRAVFDDRPYCGIYIGQVLIADIIYKAETTLYMYGMVIGQSVSRDVFFRRTLEEVRNHNYEIERMR